MSHKSSKSKSKSGGSSGAAAPATPLRDHEELTLAIESFLRENTNFESSIPVNGALDAIAPLTTLQEVFTLPLQRQLLGLEGALKWALFLSLAGARAVDAGDAPYSAAAPFSAAAALTLIAQVYDLGVSEVVDAHFEDSDYESESESESGSDSDPKASRP